MADRSACDMAAWPPKLQSFSSTEINHPLWVSHEAIMSKEPSKLLPPDEEAFNSIYPEASYIAAPAASQIIINNIDTQGDKNRAKLLPGEISITPLALALVNRLLDKILFDTLSDSQTLSMPTLRPAIFQVLKPTFGTSAMQHADMELKEYLDESEDCILSDMQEAIDSVGNADINILWRETRIRCMLYSSLGEMEDEDGLLSGSSHVAIESKMISPAVAIFLTSVLEFMGEQILAVAVRAAYQRLKSKEGSATCGPHKTLSSMKECLNVEVEDVESITFDKSLGGLWKAWKERKGLTAIFSSRSRKGLSRSLPSLRESQQINAQNAFLKKKPSSAIMTRLAYLDLAILNQTPKISSDQINTKISPSNSQIQLESSENSVTYPSKLERPKSCSVIDSENNNYLIRTRKRRANSLPQSNRPQSLRAYKRLKSLSDKEQESFQLEDYVLDINSCETDSGSLKGSLIIIEDNKSLRSSTNENFHEEEIENKNLNHETAQFEDSAVLAKSIPQTIPDALKTTDTPSSNISSYSKTSIDNEPSLNISENLNANHSINKDALERLPEPLEKFISSTPNTVKTRARSTSFQGQSSARLSLRRRPMSMSIPRSVEMKQYSGIEQSLFPSPPSQTSKACSDSVKSSSRYQPESSENLNESCENDYLRKRISRLVLDESDISGDEPASPEIANFAVAVQGVDIYNLESEFDCTNTDIEKNNHDLMQSNLWYTKPYLNDYVRKRVSEHESDGNVSPISLANDEPKSNGRNSPVSTISSIEKIPDKKTTPSSQNESVISTSAENTISKNQFKHPLPLSSNAVSPQTKYFTQSTNSRSSSRSFKAKAILHSEENTLGKFDQFIQSDQTLQYTLTPETIRDVEVSDPHQRFTRKNSEPGSSLRNTVQSSLSRHVTIDTNHSKNSPKKANSIRTLESFSKPASIMEDRRRSGAYQPRDARIERDRSLNDFASFIRNTGPDAPIQNSTISLNKISPVKQENSDANLVRNSSSRGMFHKRLDSTSTRIKFPRSDIISKRSDSISGFIDFVRSGAKVDHSNLSITYDQASYNSPTLSSKSWGNVNKNGDSSHIDPRNWQNSPSINSSVTSQSALLANTSNNRSSIIQHNNQNNGTKNNSARKVRKIRDPYPLDISDQENAGKDSLESKPTRNESLKDFLRNTSPIDLTDDNTTGKTTKVNISAPGLMSLFGRRPVSPQSSSKGLLGSIVSHQPATYSSGSKKSTNPRSFQFEPQPSLPPLNFSHRNFEPREATSRVRTDDLARFLMHTDPPPSMNETNTSAPLLLTKNPIANTHVPQKNEVSSFHRIFSRKRTGTLSKF